jgi:hypothetical protein
MASGHAPRERLGPVGKGRERDGGQDLITPSPLACEGGRARVSGS